MEKMVRRAVCLLLSLIMVFGNVPAFQFSPVVYAEGDYLILDQTETNLPINLLDGIKLNAFYSGANPSYGWKIVPGDGADYISITPSTDKKSCIVKPNSDKEFGPDGVTATVQVTSGGKTASCVIHLTEDFTKTAFWGQEGNDAQVILQSLEKKKDMGVIPNILFLGSTCTAHSLRKDALSKAINTLAKVANVDYYLYGMKVDLVSTKGPFEGTVIRGANFVNPNSNFLDTEGTTSYSGYHVSQFYFVDILNFLSREKKLDNYDLIVLEFDGLRFGETGGKEAYEVAKNLNDNYYKFDDSIHSSLHKKENNTYPQILAEFKKAAQNLQPFYENNKVIWLNPVPIHTVTDANSSSTNGGKYMYDDQNLVINNVQRQGLSFDALALLDPKTWLSSNDLSTSTDSDGFYSVTMGEDDYHRDAYVFDSTKNYSFVLDEYEGNRASETDFVKRIRDEHFNGTNGMWEYYKDSEKLEAIAAAKTYDIGYFKNVHLQDTISDGFTIKSVSGYYLDSNSDWKYIEREDLEDRIIFTYNENGQKIDAYFDLKKLNSHPVYRDDNVVYEQVKCVIDLETNEKTPFLYTTVDNKSVIYTNNGLATIEYDGNSSSKQGVKSPKLTENAIKVSKEAYDNKGVLLTSDTVLHPNDSITYKIKVENISEIFTMTNVQIVDDFTTEGKKTVLDTTTLNPGEIKYYTVDYTVKLFKDRVVSSVENNLTVTADYGNSAHYTATDSVSLSYNDRYNITTSHKGDGTITSSTNVQYGEDCEITYTPSEGWKIESITVDGKPVGTNKNPISYTFQNVTAVHNIEVVFTQTDYNITYEFTGNVIPANAKEPEKESNIHCGDPKSVDSNPQEYQGYHFSGWKTKDAIVSGTDFTMPSHDVHFTGYFTQDNYKVYYRYEGETPSGAQAPIDTTNYHVNDRAQVLNATQYDGWTFLGWTSTDVTPTDGEFVMPAKDVTFVGKWTKDPVVTFKVNDPTLGSVNETGGPVHDPTTPSIPSTVTPNKGVKLDHWENKSGTNVGTDQTLYATPSDSGWKDETYTAVLVKIPYKVTYVYLGETPSDVPALPAEKTYTYEEPVSLEHKPADTNGYSFTEWVISDTDVKANDFGLFTMPAKDLIVVGRWEKIPEITYESNNPDLGTVSRDSEIFGPDKPYSIGSVAEPIKGNEFVKWVESGSDVAVCTKTNFVPDVPSDDVHYIAVFTPCDYKVAYVYINEPDEAPAVPSKTTHRYNDPVIKAVDSKTSLEGYEFSGWTCIFPDVEIDEDGNFTMPDHDVVFMGIWNELDTVTIAYVTEDSTKGTLSTPTDTFIPGLDVPAGSTATADEKYHFVHWIDSAGKEVSTNTNFVPQIPEDGNWKNAIYIAEFAKNGYDIVYELIGEERPDGWESMVPKSETDVEWGKFKYVKDRLSAPGYTFYGWETTSTDVIVERESFTMPAHDVLFQGQFIENTATIIYKVDHEDLGHVTTATEILKVVNGTSAGSRVVTNTGVTFLGWQDEDGYIVSTDTDFVPVKPGNLWEDATYTALLTWTDYTVNYEFIGTEEGWPSNWKDLLPKEEIYHYNNPVNVKDTPRAEGWIFNFDKWFNYNADTKVYYTATDTFVMPAHDVTLYGSWTRMPLITYVSTDTNMGTVTRSKEYMNNQDNPEQTESYGSIAKPNPGYRFVAWVDADNNYCVVSTDTNLHQTKPKDGWVDANYIAVFEPIDYEITYEYVGDLIPSGAMKLLPSPTNANHVGEDKKVSTSATDAKVPGYRFSGWTTTDVIVSGTDFTMPAKDIHFVGSWTEIPHVVIQYKSQDIMEGKVTHTKDDFNPEIDSPDVSKAVAKDGYHFIKWIDEYGRTVSTSKLLDPADIKEQKDGWKDATYIAVFAPDEYKISYAYEGSLIPEGANKLLPSITVHNVVDSKKVVEDVPVIKGYIFKGWKTSDVTVKDGKFTMPAHDVKFVGVWEKEEENPNTGAPVFGNIILP